MDLQGILCTNPVLLLHFPFVPETYMRRLLFVFFALTLVTVAQTATPVVSTTQEKPLTSFPYTPGLDLASMDRTANPCVDFYQYSCGGWM